MTIQRERKEPSALGTLVFDESEGEWREWQVGRC